tara:strand:+ start:30598 stop:32826 length:2229 start_codon:yes stop_codon:yes gene_type:complete
MISRTQIITIALIFSILNFYAQEQKASKIKTRWANDVTAENVWKEYPRPQLKRAEWKNLNGLWDYSIVKKGEASPKNYQGKILVPFCVESELSGVKKTVLPDQIVWYNTSFDIPNTWKGKNILLHFDAVDWETKIWVNGKEVGVHRGGSDPFSFDITKYLGTGKQELKVSVWDPTDTGTQARGKQVLEPKGIWYTAVTGIWQTVWLEPVEKSFINSITPIADIDNKKVIIKNEIHNANANSKFHVQVKKDGKIIAEKSTSANQDLVIDIENPILWFPENPFLYELEVSLEENGKKIDEAESYFSMRKISREKDDFGYERFFLNNEPRFQYGTLDQGWWPGGLLTPPSDEAMRYDIDVLKKMGFNMLRKHIKVEPSRYYYYADKVGILVWQDMVTGFQTSEKNTQHIKFDAETDWNRPKESAEQFEKEWKAIINHLKFFPSIVTWVSFNEGWGQYDTERVVKWTQQYDPTRLVNGVSGWTDRKIGDMRDAHHYPGPGMEPAEQNPDRIIVLGEFGGLGLPIENHIWNPDMRNWGYRTYHSVEELKKQYAELIHNMAPMVNKGLAAAIYTQTTDVEGEVNGLITYDREVVKVKSEEIRKLNELMYHDIQNTEVVMPDSEIVSQTLLLTYHKPTQNNGQIKKFEFSEVSGPIAIKKGTNEVWIAKEFNLKAIPKNLQLRIYGAGDVRVYINGKLVVDKFLRTKRHYDEINLSDDISTLQRGNNNVLVEIKNVKINSDFDFGFYSF